MTRSTRIVDVRTHPVRVPLREPFVTAVRRATEVEAVLVEVVDADGVSGWGEGTESWRVTGDSLVGITAAVTGPLSAVVLGRDPDDLTTLRREVAAAVVGNTAAKSAVDVALHDLAARRLGVPLTRLLGGTSRSVATDVTLSVDTPDAMADAAVKRVAEGFPALKLKVGGGGDDLARVRAVREAVGADVDVRLDANQAWTPKQAVRTIRAIEDAGLGVALVEQPVAAQDLDGLARVTAAVATPVMADESVRTAADVLEVARRGAADLVNLKLTKCGGLGPARDFLAVADAAGLGVVVGAMMETHLAIGAAAALVAASPAVLPVTDLDSAWWLTHSPLDAGARYVGASVELPDQPGLGVRRARGPH
ncbi:L-Ala-D/L-Glu epimerase [Marmoricola endophyticus]|uniref:Dipeptide epimerase n=1 Tax=Marmoricola endophyticus TaxID=2040280 RepID=A0A917F3T5_9ACTN|nr:dipeptide epimerase [Marmoricola endophyticus]GGF45935.1 L-Ala-D/L-Glu epimerase [Marmoricola endophyticus]